jgi:GNAT superfamily N-acetyltransferase
MIQMNFSSRIFSLLSYTPLQYMLRAMESGTAPAVCYADRGDDPTVCLIREGHSLFAGGEASGPASKEAMDFLSRELLTPELRQELHVMKIVYPNEAWKELLTNTLYDASVHEYMRCVFDHPAPGSVPAVPVPHIQFITADTAMLDNFSMIRDEVESTLGSFDKFLAEGFGYALVFKNRVGGFCTAEYLSAGECAIGIEVLGEHQKKGYASHMTACFLQECNRRGLTPYWECWKNNIPSVKTAEHAGFSNKTEYPVLFIEFGRA